VADKLKKLSLYMRPEVKAAACNAAAAEGLLLSAWFRNQVQERLEHEDQMAATNLPKQPSRWK
jgi:predicted HicB family RNase H-like nuclease